jgi:hypothetical protein
LDSHFKPSGHVVHLSIPTHGRLRLSKFKDSQGYTVSPRTAWAKLISKKEKERKLAFYYPSELDVSNMAELTSQK